MTNILWRVLIAAICLVLIWALIPPFVGLLGLTIDPNLLQIFRICVAGLAVLYVLTGDRWVKPPA